MTRLPVLRLTVGAMLAVAIPHAGSAQKLTGAKPNGEVPAPIALDTTGMFQAKFAKGGDDGFIGGQPTERALRELKAQGVTTVVNLRTPEEMKTRVSFDE